jgi:hypothetical protein
LGLLGGGSAAWCSSVSPDTFPRLLEAVFFAPLLEVMAAEVATRGCPAIGDEAFAALCVLRVLQSSKSGRDFLRVHGIPNPPGLNRGHYFASLASKRRLAMLHDTLAAMGRKLLSALRADDDDLLAVLPGLDGWEVWRADGHAIEHATHDPCNQKNAHSPAHAIHQLDLRTGWAGFIDLVRPTEN